MSRKTIIQVMQERSNDYTELEKYFKEKTGIELVKDFQAIPPPLKNPLHVSIVIPAYNVQTSIKSCLTSIEQSHFNKTYPDNLQVIVVDDGSKDDSWDLIKNAKLNMHMTAIHQTNYGQAQALNTGISVATGDIIISCDADMVLAYYTIDHFVLRHQHIPNAVFAGFRTDADPTDNIVNADYLKQNGTHLNSYFSNDERFQFPTPGYPSNICLMTDYFKKLGKGKGLLMPNRDAIWLLSDLVVGALFSMNRTTFNKVGGYDERLIGWGCTDGFLAAKAIAADQFIIPVIAASGLHIWHPDRRASKQEDFEFNRNLFHTFIQTTSVDEQPDWITPAKKRINETFTVKPKKEALQKRIGVTDENYLLECYNAVGEYEKVLSLLEKIPHNHSTSRQTYLKANALKQLHNYKEAIMILKTIASEEFNYATDLLMTYAANEEFEKAHQRYKELAAIHGKNPAYAYWFIFPISFHLKQGALYLDQKFYEQAKRCFEVALIRDPQNKKAQSGRETSVRLLG